MFLGLRQQARRDRPAAQGALQRRLHAGRDGNADIEIWKIAHQYRYRLAIERRHALHLGDAGAGQNEQQRARPLPFAARRMDRRVAGEFVQLLDERMADVNASGAAEAHMRLRLEGQQRKHAIDIFAHRSRASRPPGPDRRAHIIHDRQARRRAANAARDAMGEIRRVDDDKTVGLIRQRRARRFVYPRNERRQSRKNGKKAHHGDVGIGKEGLQPLARHRLAADAGKCHVGPRGAQCAHQRRAQDVAGRFSDDDKNARRFHASRPRARGAQKGRADGRRRKRAISATSASAPNS